MNILAIDSSNQVMSVAVLNDSKIVGEITTNVKRNHSESLMPAIDEVIKMAHLKPTELDRIAVAMGPGSYTGLRIGVTIAKTLAWTLNKELVGISSLKVLAANCENASGYLVPIMDARRGNIYTGLYQWVNGELEAVEPETHCSAEKWADYLATLQGEFEIVGEDWELYQQIFEEKLGHRVMAAPLKDRIPKASVLGLLSRSAETSDPHTFVPNYLKYAEAEENWRKAHPDQLEESYVEKI